MTVQQLIDYALQDIAVIDPGETPSTSERTTAFDILNQLLSNWSAQAAPIPQLTRELIALTGAESYTLPTRPIKIKSAAVFATTVMSFPAKVVDAAEFAAYPDKVSQVSWPRVAWYEEGYPLSKIHIAPTPAAGGTIQIHSEKGIGAASFPVYEAFALSAGTGEYSIGVGGTFNAERPLKVTGVSISATGIASKEARIVDASQWAQQNDRSSGGTFADVVWYDGALSSPKIYVAPRPAAGSLELISYRPLTAFALISDTISLAPGYERALRLTLAMELASSYGAQPNPALVQAAEDARGSIFGLNQAVLGSIGQPPIDPQPQPAPVIVAQ